MGSRRGARGFGWVVLLGWVALGWVALGCDGSDRVSLAAMPEGAAGAGAAGGAAGSGGLAGDGLAGDGLADRAPEGSPMIAGVDGLGDAPVAPGGSTPATSTPSTASTGGVDGGTHAGADPGGVPGAGGASADGADAGSRASPAAGGASSSAGSGGGASSSGGGTEATGPDDAVIVNLEASALSAFAPPIDSSRYAVAGYDAATGVCVSIIWDYSNNGLELARHCDDFGQYVSFPYVLVEAGSAAACVSFWGYVGLQPSAASGCIDPVEGLVNVRLEVESEGVRYSIRAVNEPALVGP